MSYTKDFNPKATPQSQAAPGKTQVENNAGGFVFEIDKWARLERFLILGSDAPTYYQKARDLTRENGQTVMDCWATDPDRTGTLIVEISVKGRAPKQDPAIFALALGAVHDDKRVRQVAYLAVGDVCRTASQLFQWIASCYELGKGGGRGFKRAIAGWYGQRSTDELAYQAIKYRERNGITHKRAIEVGHKGAGEDEARAALYLWARGKETYAPDKLPARVQQHLEAMKQTEPKAIAEIVKKANLPREAIPTQSLRSPEVWEAMLPTMPLTAMIRNLGNMTEVGALAPMKTSPVVEKLANVEALRKARVHPFSILQALAVYRSGGGILGKKTWKPLPDVLDALDKVFYMAFENVEPTGKRIMLAVDVSSSMSREIGGSSLSCREAAAALALVTKAREPNAAIFGFSSLGGLYSYGLEPLAISPHQRLDDVVESMVAMPMGGTDCALPMQYAAQHGLAVDAFVILTDNETWAGKSEHPFEALKRYRAQSGINAKCIVVGMTSTGFSIADPNDGGMLDLVGLDSHGPALISDFIKQ